MVKFSKVARGAANIIDIGPPPVGLEPQGDGWYRTPKNVDPRDCNNWSSSPFCGGNPINPKLAEIDVEVGISECHIHVSASATVFGLTGPTHTIAKVRDGCIQDYENRNNPPPPSTPPPTPGVYSFKYPHGLDEEMECYAFIGTSYAGAGTGFNSKRCVDAGYLASFAETDIGYLKWVSVNCPGLPDSKGRRPAVSGRINSMSGGSGGMYNSTIDCFTHVDGSMANHASNAYKGWDLGEMIFTWGVNDASGRMGWYYGSNPNDKVIVNASVNVTAEVKVQQLSNFVTGFICKGKWKHIKAAFKNGSAAANYSVEYSADFVIGTSCQSAKLDPNFPPPPPPPKKECCPMGQCCPQSPPVDNSLLRRIEATLARIEKNIGIFPVNATIFDANENAQEAQTQTVSIGSISQGVSRTIERVEKVSKIIGIDALPLTVPETISEPVNQNILQTVWDWLTPDATRRINNLFELLVWQTEQYSATMGQWQQSIEIEDTDVLQEGGQKQKIALPDVATTLKEILSLQMQTYKTLGLVLDITLKDLTQDAATYKELIAVQMNIKEMIDFLDYQTDEKYVDVPVQISVPGTDISQEEQNNLAKYLKPSTIKVRYQNWTGYKSLTDLLTHLATLMGRR